MAQLAPVIVPRVRPDGVGSMIDVDEARERILRAFAPLPMIRVPLDGALGMTLAVDVIAGMSVPTFANAAMDGFALRSADTLQATPHNPVRLRVVGEAAAGTVPDVEVGPGEAVRIMTGAPVPAGADAVVRFEETDETHPAPLEQGRPGGLIGIRKSARPGENVRPIGEDFHAGETLLAAGARLRPVELGLLATLNRTNVTVHRRPRVAILATGDEVVDPGQELAPGQIRNSNSVTVAALVRRCGGDPILLGIARDSAEHLQAKLAEARGADLILTTGGVSVGDYDLVKRVLQQEGRIELWQVRIKPGKPLAFGWLGTTPLLGLPGNPVAAVVAFEQFSRPAIGRMLGQRDLTIPTMPARLHGSIDNRGGRRHYVRVTVEWAESGYVATPAGAQGAGVLSTLTRANGLMVVPEDVPRVEDGWVLPVQMVDWESA